MSDWTSPKPWMCPYCGSSSGSVSHGPTRCPAVAAIEYHPNGSIKRLEFNR